LEPTEKMLRILRQLRRSGRAHALAELDSMGYLARKMAVPAQPPGEPPPPRPSLVLLTDTEIEATLRARLHSLTMKIERDALAADLSSMATSAIERAVVKVLGARGIAADLVSPTFGAGLGDTFEAHADLVDGWEITAILDGATCDPCAELDGSTYATTADLMEVMSGFAGVDDCDGGDRCRCRAIPSVSG